jgi:hypothetical protein
MIASTSSAGSTASVYQAQQNPMLVEGTRAEETAETVVQRAKEDAAEASGAASKATAAANTAAGAASSGKVDTYA